MRRWILLMMVLMASGSCVAQPVSIQPPEPPDSNDLTSTLTAAPVGRLMLGSLAVELEVTKLSEARRAIGTGEIQHEGDAAGSEYWLCYTLLEGKEPERIWLSAGELGGGEHLVGSFYASEMSEAKGLTHCPALPARFEPVSFDNSLWLGSTPEQLKNVLGEPSERRGDWWWYSYSGKAPDNADFDQVTIFGVRIRDGKIVDAFASRTTTN